MERLIIVGNPVPKDWEFQRGIQDATGQAWQVLQCVTNEYGGVSKLTRYIKYFMLPVLIFLRRSRYSDILSRDQFFGIVLAFYCRLFHVKKAPDIHVMTFIYKRKKGLVGKVYEWFVRYAVTSRYVKHIFVFGRSEIDYYAELFGLSREIFTAETLGIKDSGMDFPQIEKDMPEGYYTAAGRSNRDYVFLRDAWPEKEEDLYIICDVEKAEDTANVHYKKNCFGNAYLGVMAHARAIIVPLADEHISSGQLVVLHASMLGKPVIITKNDTVGDYVTEGENGLIIDKTPEALREAMAALREPVRYEAICRSARKMFEREFSLYQLGRRMGAKLKQDQRC